MKRFLILILALVLMGLTGVAQAVTYVEDFEADFPAWENGWLGTNSNLTNYYGVGQYRGNNPDGLWVDDGDGLYGTDTVEIVFKPAFGASLTSLNIDLAGWHNFIFKVFDSSSNEILSQNIAPNYGAYTDPGTYVHVGVLSDNGISMFSFVYIDGQIEGNTSIDNVVVTTSVTPLPGAFWLLGSGLVGLLGMNCVRRK